MGAWAQFGGGHGGRVPPLFQTGGHNMPCSPTFLSLGFFGEVLKIKMAFLRSFMLDVSHSRVDVNRVWCGMF